MDINDMHLNIINIDYNNTIQPEAYQFLGVKIIYTDSNNINKTIVFNEYNNIDELKKLLEQHDIKIKYFIKKILYADLENKFISLLINNNEIIGHIISNILTDCQKKILLNNDTLTIDNVKLHKDYIGKKICKPFLERHINYILDKYLNINIINIYIGCDPDIQFQTSNCYESILIKFGFIYKIIDISSANNSDLIKYEDCCLTDKYNYYYKKIVYPDGYIEHLKLHVDEGFDLCSFILSNSFKMNKDYIIEYEPDWSQHSGIKLNSTLYIFIKHD